MNIKYEKTRYSEHVFNHIWMIYQHLTFFFGKPFSGQC